MVNKSRSHASSAARQLPDILVTGGSGFIGQKVVKALAGRGHSIVSMYHHRLPEPLNNVFPVCSDMGSAELLAAPLRGVNTVVHLAWSGGLVGPGEGTSWDPAVPERLPKNIQILRSLLAAMERAGTKRIVFVSALGASRHTSVPFLMEKYLGEFFILNSSIKEKLIVRSGVVCSSEDQNDRFMRSITRLMKFPVLYPVPRRTETISPVLIEDLVELLADVCFHQIAAPSAIMEFVGGESFKIEELFKLVSDNLVGGTRLPVKGFLGDSLLPFFERDPRDETKRMPKLRDFLALGTKLSNHSTTNNPLADVLPEKFHSFRESMNAVRQSPPKSTDRPPGAV